jgi:hypothetical protein
MHPNLLEAGKLLMPRRARGLVATGFSIAAIALLAGGCDLRSDEIKARESASETANEFIGALQAHEGAEACELIAPAALRELTAGARSCAAAVTLSVPWGVPPAGRVDDVRIDGSHAFVVTTGHDQITLKRAEDGWKVTGLLRRTLPGLNPSPPDR